jgi:hypothetical protein
MRMSGSACVQVVAEEILRGRIFGLGDPLTYSGIAIVPIVKLGAEIHWRKRYDIVSEFDRILDAIIGSLPGNTCGVFVLDSLGDVLAFKFHQEVRTFWERIKFVERLVTDQYRDSRKPISTVSASSRAIEFLLRLKMEGPEGIMSSKTDYFAVSRTDADIECENTSLLATTAVVLYCVASQ